MEGDEHDGQICITVSAYPIVTVPRPVVTDLRLQRRL